MPPALATAIDRLGRAGARHRRQQHRQPQPVTGAERLCACARVTSHGRTSELRETVCRQRLEHVRRLEHVDARELLGARVGGAPHGCGRRVEVVVGATELDAWSKQQPVRRAGLLKGMPTLPALITRVAPTVTIELDVRVAADHQIGQPIRRTPAAAARRTSPRDDFFVVPRRGVTEEHGAEAGQSPGGRAAARRPPRRAARAVSWSRLQRSSVRTSLGHRRRPPVHLGQASRDRRCPGCHRVGSRRASQAFEHFARHRSRHHVAADDHEVHRLACDLRQHRVERRQVAVDVVERGDAHAVDCRMRVPRPRAEGVARREPEAHGFSISRRATRRTPAATWDPGWRWRPAGARRSGR